MEETKQKETDARQAGYAEAAGKDMKDAEEVALNTTLRKLTCALLSCGEQDLDVLGRVRYSWEDVLSRITWEDTVQELLRFEDLMWAVVDVGVVRIKDALTEHIYDLSNRWPPDGELLDEDEAQELLFLSLLDPEHDIFSSYSHQEHKAHTWFSKNCEKVYRQYLPEVLEAFERDTGIKIENRRLT